MNDQLKEFIARVEAFEIDSDNKTLRFVDRLARENRWTVTYAGRVVREYLRFCILAMRSGHPVTPSEDVDQAWHLHLTYTRFYWERFCGETLGSPLHHEPTAGGPGEGNKFRNWYQETLDSYRQLFGSDAPPDIWPPTAQRFAHAGEFKWMNGGREWAVPKRLVAVCAGAVPCSIAAALISLGVADVLRVEFAATPVAGIIFPFDLGGTAFLVFYAVLSLLGLVAVLALRIAASAFEGVRGPRAFGAFGDSAFSLAQTGCFGRPGKFRPYVRNLLEEGSGSCEAGRGKTARAVPRADRRFFPNHPER